MMQMKRRRKTVVAVLLCVICAGLMTACNTSNYAQSGQKIIPAAKLADYLGKEHVVVVDMQTADAYAAAHVQGAVNITQEDIVINVPVKIM